MSLVLSCEGLSPTGRDLLLDQECVGDGQLRQEIELRLERCSSTLRSDAQSSDREKALPNHYRLIKLIGSGGMADVYLAEDSRLKRLVAIKFLNDAFRNDADRMRRFSQEARSASALNHPNIITIYDIGETDGAQFIVTEYVEGETLSFRIRRSLVPLEETVDITIQIAAALHEAHKAGIVHRDLKPENVMLRLDGSVKVLDFGLAKGSRSDAPANLEAKTIEAFTTSPGLILGTPQYMSPEQTRGLSLDGRSDIFSLGCVIFEMLTGKTAFAGQSTVDIIAAIIGQEARQLKDHMLQPPPELIRIVEKTLRKDRDQRYMTMEHLLSDLKDLKQELIDDSGWGRATQRANAPGTLNETMPSGVLGRWKWMLVAPVIAMVMFFSWWFYGNSGRPGISPGSPMRSIAVASWSSSSGESVTASFFSPDSKMVAFASTRSGATEIWVKQTAAGDPIQVTKNGYYNQFPVWSPNGQELAFFSRRADNDGIWRVAFTGGQEIQVATGITASARPLRWASDGNIYLWDEIDLFAIDQSSGERKQVTNFAADGIKPKNLAVSADGSMFVILVKENELWKIKAKRFDAGSFTEIASSKEKIENIACSPIGNTIFYSRMVDSTLQIFKVESGQPAIQVSNGNADFYVQDASSDGSKILYSSIGETSDIWMIDSQDAKETPVANDMPSEYWPDVSPDGKSVVFQSVLLPDRPFRGSIFVKPLAATGSPTLVSPDGFLPTWSHDGQLIAFIRRTDNGFGIWKARASGADAVNLVDGLLTALPYLGTPYLKIGTSPISWSPDDRFIAYSRTVDGMPNIWLAAADGSKTYALTSNKNPNEPYTSPVWTPDGRSIVFISDTTSSGEKFRRLWLIHIDTAEQQQIYELKGSFVFIGLNADAKEAVIAETSDATDLSPTPASTNIFSVSLQTGTKRLLTKLADAYFYNIHLSRDGRTFAFVTRRNNITEVWSVPVSGGTPRKIIVENDPKVLFSSLAWSPDNRSIVVGKQTRTNLLSMLTN